MKKLATFVSIFVLIICSVLFVGCKNERNVTTHAINMSRYFLNNVKSVTNQTTYLTLPSFVREHADNSTLRQHKTLTFSRNDNWLTGMYIECVYFYVVFDKTMADCQLSFSICGLSGGTYDPVTSSYVVEKNDIGINSVANVGTLIKIDIGYKATASAVNMIFSCENAPQYDTCNWTIYGLTVYGETRI